MCYFFYFIVTIFLSGALSLTAITFNRVIGIAMPRLANMLEMNRFIVYAILALIWILSFGTAVPTFNYRRYDVTLIIFTCKIFFQYFFYFFSIFTGSKLQGLYPVCVCRRWVPKYVGMGPRGTRKFRGNQGTNLRT